MSALLRNPIDPVITAQPGPCPTIQTKRLVLRPHRLSDADAITASLGDFQVARMLARVPAPFDRQDALDWLSAGSVAATPDWTFAITNGDDVHIGCVAVELRHGQFHLGYWLNRYYWGRGYAGEAAHAALDRFFRRMPQTTVHSGVFADNAASLRLQHKLGFAITGCRDIYVHARNAMVSHVETQIAASNLRSPR